MACLYVVGTPIGNLSEVSPRVRETLDSCPVILAEDTRVTQKLLSALDISGKQLTDVGGFTREYTSDLGDLVDLILSCDLYRIAVFERSGIQSDMTGFAHRRMMLDFIDNTGNRRILCF